MARRFRNTCSEARLRMIVGIILVLTGAGMGYLERNAKELGAARPGQIMTLTAQSSDCGRVALVASGGGCGSPVRGVGKITFLSSSK